MNKTVLCIIDGLGQNESDFGNAVFAAGMKNLTLAKEQYPSTLIKASGLEVGLADAKDPGNSEVGHNAIGCGQYIKQGLALLNEQFATAKIFESESWKILSQHAEKTKLHVINLLSDGRLHSDIYKHLFPLLGQCAKEGIQVSIHALVDGRDVPTQSAMKYIQATREQIMEVGANAKIATLAGRSVLWMDRYEANTKLLANAVEVCARGNGTVVTDVERAINAEYQKRPDMTDETMPAFILEPEWLIANGDAVLLLNYRGDRAVETCDMFEKGKYLTAEQFALINHCHFVGVLQYDAEQELPKNYLCPPPVITNTLSEWLTAHNVRQYSVTETVKFGHLTYFFNGNRAKPFSTKLETWKEFKSDECSNMYNTAPKMKAYEITNAAITALETGTYDFIKLNIPNPDMVGHTGDFDATVTACQTVDECIGKLLSACKEQKANLMITADHGNAEFMKYENGLPRSSHTNSLVPFILCPFASGDCKINNGEFGLTNIAATVCQLLGIESNKVFNEAIIQ